MSCEPPRVVRAAKCVFCHGEQPDGAARCHARCQDEWDRRYDACVCTMCGAECAARPHRCGACMIADNPPYVGYPGGPHGR